MSVEERVEVMKEMDAVELCQTVPLAQHFSPLIDETFLPKDVKLEDVASGEGFRWWG